MNSKMHDRLTKYNPLWEEELKFIKPGTREYLTKCTNFNSVISIKNGGRNKIVKQNCSGKIH